MSNTTPPMQYADLHRHLDGSMRIETFRELAEQCAIDIPDDLRFYRGMGLEQALARFAVTLSVLQKPDAVCRVAREICEDAIREGVTTLEIRFAPQLHKGGPIEDILDAAIEGIDGRAGLILCGLYGESPAMLEQLVSLAPNRPTVVGIDLAGGPMPEHQWSMLDYAPPFVRARDLGLGRTVHAGEGRNAQEIRCAITELFAQRIGHGTTLLSDEGVVALVLDKNITIEACVTSNMHVGAIPEIEAHPIPHWLQHGVRVCICTDNTLLSDVDAPTEHTRVLNIPGMNQSLLAQAVVYGHQARFQIS
jgi:adenosine deaminase